MYNINGEEELLLFNLDVEDELSDKAYPMKMLRWCLYGERLRERWYEVFTHSEKYKTISIEKIQKWINLRQMDDIDDGN